MSAAPALIAAIEAGGTKIVCGMGTGPDDLRETTRIPTTTPTETLATVADWLEAAQQRHGRFDAIGIGSFGPIDLRRESPTYGFITTTPKPSWQNTEVVGYFQQRFGVPVGFDTDVNAAVLAEHLWGAGQGKDPVLYITVGTGVGGGVYANGSLLHGLLHPEIGHVLVSPPMDSPAPHPECQCPFHRHCLEGYVSGTSIGKRWDVKADTLPPEHPAWTEVAQLMGQALVSLTVTLSPQRIVLGGGVMQQARVIPLIRSALANGLNGYLRVPELETELDRYVVAPGLGTQSGLLGSLALGQRALATSIA